VSTRFIHPTKELLITAAVELLDAKPGERLLVDEVLAHSGISRGSLYHHFQDFNDLYEAALLHQFSRMVDASADRMAGLLTSAYSPASLRDALFAMTELTQADANAQNRLLRARIIGEAKGNSNFNAKLGIEVDRLNQVLEDLIHEAINRGWFKPEFSARSIALFIQAYTLGKVLNDVTTSPVPEVEWNQLINSAIDRLLINH
jgi:AcrR family transcriptional regulator